MTELLRNFIMSFGNVNFTQFIDNNEGVSFTMTVDQI